MCRYQRWYSGAANVASAVSTFDFDLDKGEEQGIAEEQERAGQGTQHFCPWWEFARCHPVTYLSRRSIYHEIGDAQFTCSKLGGE
jgi:hypothetical protein